VPPPRPYPHRTDEPSYDGDHEVRRVRSNGEIKWRGDHLFLSETLIGELVGIVETETGDWLVRFCGLDLAVIGRRTNVIRRQPKTTESVIN